MAIIGMKRTSPPGSADEPKLKGDCPARIRRTWPSLLAPTRVPGYAAGPLTLACCSMTPRRTACGLYSREKKISFAVPQIDATELTYTDMDDSRIACAGFGRGLCVIDDTLVATGSSPSTIALHDLAVARTRSVVAMDDGECVRRVLRLDFRNRPDYAFPFVYTYPKTR